MDLLKFYTESVKKDEYYFTFYDLLTQDEIDHYSFLIDTFEQAVREFKSVCDPIKDKFSFESECWFYLLLFYFKQNGYYLSQFPNLVESPPRNRYDFSNKEIRNRLISMGKSKGHTVSYVERRNFIQQFQFVKRDDCIRLENEIDNQFKRLSPRSAEFRNMTDDEKLTEILNMIEFILKKDDKFIKSEIDIYSLGLITNSSIFCFRKKLQCFRHAHEVALKERESFSDNQKKFLIDYGLTVINALYREFGS